MVETNRVKVTKGQTCHYLLKIFLCFRFYFDFIIDYIYGLYYDSTKKTVPPITNPILLESATSLARKIRKKELKVEVVVQTFIERIKEVNGVINAVVDNRFDDALREARQLDKEIAIGNILDVDFQTKPFLGVPFTSKESTACQGLSFTFGLKSRAGRKSTFDARIVEQMKDAGAILLAVTNVPQLNLWQEVGNPVYGTTNNPYDTTRNVGGSSGGESAILAACASPMGLGTDIGGSLRIPAFMCGVFGHKPTSNLISTKGLTFRTGTEGDTMVVCGPMTRYSEDLLPILKVLLGTNVNKLNLDKIVDIRRDVRVFYVENPKDPFVSPFRPEMKEIFQKVVKYFAEIQAVKPEKCELNDLKYGGPLWRYWMTQEPNANFNRDIGNRENEVNSLVEICKFLAGKSDFGTPVIYNFINNLRPKVNATWARETTKKLQKILIDKLGTNGVLLYPSAPWPASYHHTALLRPWNFNLFSIWNVLKFPVTQVPLGLAINGLPLGIQVVAAPNQDHLTLAVATELERQFGGYVPPAVVNN